MGRFLACAGGDSCDDEGGFKRRAQDQRFVMVRIGIVGIGFMGWAHFSGAMKFTEAGRVTGSRLKGGAVTTICTRNPEKLIGDWTSIQGNYGPPGTKLDLSKIVAFDNY